jgi:hypothetical protein
MGDFSPLSMSLVLSITSEFEGAFSFEIALVIDIVLGVFWIPVRVTELIFFLEILLWSPEFFAAMRILLRWEWSGIFRNIHLILSHHVMDSGIHLILEPSEWNTEIIIWMDSNWQLSRNRIPRVLVHFPNRSITEDHHCHLIISCRWPKDLNLLSLRISNNLSSEISLISFIEYINTVVDDKISIINFFVWG